MSDKLTVLSPLGFPPQVTANGLAQSLSSLDGKRLFLVDVGFENSDNFMIQLQGWLAEHEPSVETESRPLAQPASARSRALDSDQGGRRRCHPRGRPLKHV